jgi:hypothetical protein
MYRYENIYRTENNIKGRRRKRRRRRRKRKRRRRRSG